MTTSDSQFDSNLAGRHRTSKIFHTVCALATLSGIVILIVLLICVATKAYGWLNLDFLTSHDSSLRPHKAGVLAGIWGSVWCMVFTALFSIPVGVGAAIYLEEYASENRFTRLIRLNIANLAGVPSIVFGILGLTVFVRVFSLSSSVLAGALTLSLLILPIVIIACQEALRAVPQSIRHGALALGATKWQTIQTQVLPAAVPGIMTGVILSLSRAIGETAPLIVVGAATFIRFSPGRIDSVQDLVKKPSAVASIPSSEFTVIPLQIYNWVSIQAKDDFRFVAAAAIIVLLGILLLMNGLAVYLRHRFQKKLNW